MSGEINGFTYKCLNPDNKVKHLIIAEKKEIIRKYNNDISVKDLAKEYNKVEKYIENCLKF